MNLLAEGEVKLADGDVKLVAVGEEGSWGEGWCKGWMVLRGPPGDSVMAGEKLLC